MTVLLVDQMLNENPDENGNSANYKGHDIVALVRKAFPELPIFIVTAVPDDPELVQQFGAADDVIDREQMLTNPGYLERILRQGSRFFKFHEEELSRLAELSEFFAMGKTDKEMLNELKALQVKLGIGFEVPTQQDALLSLISDEVSKAKELAKKIQQEIENKRHE